MKTIKNKRAGRCHTCQAQLKVGDGFVVLLPSGWAPFCNSSQCLPEEAQSKIRKPQRVLTADGLAIIEPFDREALPLLRALPGARWDADAVAWRVSLADVDRSRLLEMADRLSLEVAPELQAVEQTPSADAAVTRASEHGYPFQLDGVRWLAPRKRALLADDMGIGKTLQALWSLDEGARAIVICPNSLKYNWHDECLRWRPDLTPIVCKGRSGKQAFRFPENDGELIIINYDILPSWLKPEPTGEKARNGREIKRAPLTDEQKSLLSKVTLIADECQRVKKYKSHRSQKVTEMALLADKVWFLTGTPMENRPFDLWGVLSAGGMNWDVFGSWPTFLRCFGGFKNRWDGYEFSGPTGPETAERLRRVMLRRTKAEVLPDLPSKTYTEIKVNDLPRGLKRDMDDLWDEWGDVIEAGELPPFEEFSSIRAQLAESRIDAAVERIEDYEDAGTPLVVFSAHRKPIETIGSREGWAMILGGTPAEKRREIVRAFQAGELKGVALTIRAGGEGLTLTQASDMLFVDMDWTPAQNCQAEDRICRIGQQASSINIIRLVSNHVLDIHVLDLLARKQELIEAAIEMKAAKVEAKGENETEHVELKVESREDMEARKAAIEAAAHQTEIDALREMVDHKDWLGRMRSRANGRPEPVLTPERIEATRRAFGYMLSVCDGAETIDDVGFNKPDALMARKLMMLGLEDLNHVRIAERMLSRYHRQLHADYPILFVG